MLRLRAGRVALLTLIAISAGPARAADWPMWRYDASRTAASPEALPAALHLRWSRQLPAPRPAWPRQQDDGDKLAFDHAYAPVVLGKSLFVCSMTQDSLTAYDTATGEERWRFYAEGPARFAPAAWQGKVYFVSDDGCLYCLDAATGALRWKFRGGPSAQSLLGNGRLISCWPARGAPVVHDGTVYFTAGIWPFMGVFLYALDAETGAVRWANTGDGSLYTKQQHDSPAFAGVAPQGYLAITGDTLLIPGGRTPPACYDRATGRLRAVNLADRTFGKDAGGYDVSALGQWFFSGAAMYRTSDIAPIVPLRPAALAEDTLFGLDKGQPAAYAAEPVVREAEERDNAGMAKIRRRYALRQLWKAPADLTVDAAHLRAGARLYCSARGGRVLAVDLPRDGRPAALSWEGRVPGEVGEMLAADGRLFVTTREGGLYCFEGEPAPEPRKHTLPSPAIPAPDEWTRRAGEILRATGKKDGYCLVWGAGKGRLAEELARQSALHVIAVDPDPAKVAALRRRLCDAGLYGTRVALLTGDPESYPFPPYLAELVVAEALPSAGKGAVERLFHSLRPYGGVACLPAAAASRAALAGRVEEAGLKGAEVKSADAFTLLVRAGALPGAGAWTHERCDAGNTVCSSDSLVKAPLGLLWFGGSTNHKVLPRHGHGPSPQVVGGRLFILGPDTLSARDVYTGRTLWEAPLPGVGKAFDNTSHQPGANALGSNYVSLADGVYVHLGSTCVRLDPATGRVLATFALPVAAGDKAPPPLGYIGAWQDLLILTVEPQIFDEKRIGLANWNATASKRLLVLDRNSGKVLWSREAEYGFRHNAIVAGKGKLFCIDRLSDAILQRMRRQGEPANDQPKLLALDIRTGAEAWRAAGPVFGTWLGYSAERDVLLQSGRPSRDMLEDETADRMVAYRGADGSVLWDRQMKYEGPLILRGEEIISSARNGGKWNLLTGEPITRRHPITGATIPWTYSRQYGCGTVFAGQHLLTFRSAAAGYYDLVSDCGTGNFGGFKSGCTNNLIVADGVLSAPDYTRTCTCSYQNQTSLALAPMPEVETWAWSTLPKPLEGDARVRRVGINLGAPGDRLADDGTLWLDYPSVGGTSPDIPVSVQPAEVRWFRGHSAFLEGGPLPWVAASGVEGATAIALTLASGAEADRERAYTVRLYFAEPEARAAGERVFSVSLQGKPALADFDIVRQAGGRNRGVVCQFTGVSVTKDLAIALAPAAGSKAPPLLCGVSVVAEE